MIGRKSFVSGLPVWYWRMTRRLKCLTSSRIIWNNTIDRCSAKVVRKKKLQEEHSRLLATGKPYSGKSNHCEIRRRS